MSDEEMVQCPAEGCDGEFASVGSLKGHWAGSKDGKHDGSIVNHVVKMDRNDDSEASTDVDPEENDEENDETNVQTNVNTDPPTEEGSGIPEPERPAPTGTGGTETSRETTTSTPTQRMSDTTCCNDPELRDVPAGKRFRTEDGRVGRTEEGDEYCETCGAVIADGEVYR